MSSHERNQRGGHVWETDSFFIQPLSPESHPGGRVSQELAALLPRGGYPTVPFTLHPLMGVRVIFHFFNFYK